VLRFPVRCGLGNKKHSTIRKVITMKINLREIPAFYVNLDSRIDLRERMESTLSRLGFSKIYRSPGVVVPDAPVCVGIAHAYKNAFDLAESVSNGGPFLMFDDDALPTDAFTADIEVPNDFDAVYLGISRYGRRHSDGCCAIDLVEATYISDTMAKINSMLSSHAILYAGINNPYTQKVRDRLLPAIREKIHCDIEMARSQPDHQVYAFVDPLFYQTSQEWPTRLKLTDFVPR
jgi:hypothetical protein